MGSWSVSCGISNIAITSGNKCVILPLKKNSAYGEGREWQPATLPIFGEYNDYGGMENIEEDDNTKLIEDHFGVTIDEFVCFLVDGNYTYDREEAKEVAEKMKNFEEAKNFRFMWIDRQVYDFMIVDLDKHEKGYMDFGSEKTLKELGFEKIDGAVCMNYDPKRFNQLWRKGDIEMFSDGDTLLSTKGNYVYYIGHGNDSSLETYIDLPESFKILADLNKYEAWRFLSKNDAKKELGFIFGSSFEFAHSHIDDLIETIKDQFTPDQLEKLELNKKPKKVYNHYYDDLDTYGDRIAKLINVMKNLHPMSGLFEPHKLYLTPQCGEYNIHQKILNKFCEINKSYCHEEE